MGQRIAVQVGKPEEAASQDLCEEKKANTAVDVPVIPAHPNGSKVGGGNPRRIP